MDAQMDVHLVDEHVYAINSYGSIVIVKVFQIDPNALATKTNIIALCYNMERLHFELQHEMRRIEQRIVIKLGFILAVAISMIGIVTYLI